MRIVFMGTGEIALPSLEWLLRNDDTEVVGVFTQPDKKVGREQTLTPPRVKTMAAKQEVPVFQPISFKKEPGAITALEDLRCDIAVVMAYGQILPQAVINIPKIVCVNLHASLLPRHRGASPIQAAIREGDEETGITLMHIAPELDAGDMILKMPIEITPHDTGGTLHDRLAELGPEVLIRGLPLLFAGQANRDPQAEEEVTYSGKLSRDDGEIDWSQPATSIERMIRAYDPWPGTSTILPGSKRNRKLKLFPFAEVGTSGGETPGTILDVSGSLEVACGDRTSLRLTGDLQLEGKKRMSIRDFLKGSNLETGIKLGKTE